MLHRFVTNTRARALVLALFVAATLALRANAAPAEPLSAGQALTFKPYDELFRSSDE